MRRHASNHPRKYSAYSRLHRQSTPKIPAFCRSHFNRRLQNPSRRIHPRSIRSRPPPFRRKSCPGMGREAPTTRRPASYLASDRPSAKQQVSSRRKSFSLRRFRRRFRAGSASRSRPNRIKCQGKTPRPHRSPRRKRSHQNRRRIPHRPSITRKTHSTKKSRSRRLNVHPAIPRRARKSPPLFPTPTQPARRSRRLNRPAAPGPLHGHVPRLRNRHPGRRHRSPYRHCHLRHPPKTIAPGSGRIHFDGACNFSESNSRSNSSSWQSYPKTQIAPDACPPLPAEPAQDASPDSHSSEYISAKPQGPRHSDFPSLQNLSSTHPSALRIYNPQAARQSFSNPASQKHTQFPPSDTPVLLQPHALPKPAAPDQTHNDKQRPPQSADASPTISTFQAQ